MAEMQVKTVEGVAQLVPAEGVIAKDNNGTMEQIIAPIGEHPTNFEAYVNDQVGQYQTDTDHIGTVMGANGIETFEGTPETPAEPAEPGQ